MKPELPKETNDVMATHHEIQAMYHLLTSMMYSGKVKDEAQFRAEILPVFELLAEGAIRSSDKTIDKLTEEARAKIDKIRKNDT